MFVPSSFVTALLLTILCTFCWGSFANTFKLTKNYRFELYYWDYGLGIFLISLFYAFTLGSTGGGIFSFLPNMRQADAIYLLYAAAGGFIFNIANILLVAGIDMVGLAIAFPISIGIALVEGTVLSYLIHPQGNPILLAAGVLMALVAVVFIGMADATRGGAAAVSSRKGTLVCLVSGVLMGVFAPLITKATQGSHPDASLLVPIGALSPYTAAVFMTLGAFLCCFVFNPILMRKPLAGAPVSISGYFAAPSSYHALGLLGGAVWGTGTVLNFVAGRFVGLPISYAIGQASPMIATLWGVLAWHEFRGARTKSWIYLGAMFLSYLLALALIALAYRAV
jgi:glucose uptake protein